FCVEFLCRAGIGKIAICDYDRIRPSNRNRQIPSLISTEGKQKTEVMKERLLEINPELFLKVFQLKFNEHSSNEILSEDYNYVVDAIDTLSPKVFLIENCVRRKIRIVSSMGAGEKISPSLVRCCDIEESFQCPLARLVRKRLHKFGIRGGVKVVFSPEKNIIPYKKIKAGSPIGSISYMPAIFAVYCASTVITDIIQG
ncbi:MAG TPA: tRNA threonylcarbamoyladenosine dehydratase, partial [Victivallales bacterium]|nr:tRNA threonylcarbamoyladenosine dehydratase [Victivallales bacterium]